MFVPFKRSGELKDLSSYPIWLQEVVTETNVDKARVVGHRLFSLMRDARLPLSVMRRFLIGTWPTIEQFPRFMAKNLEKISFGESEGHDMARRYLMHNIRVEQKHADHWVEWAKSANLSVDDLRNAEGHDAMTSLAHWCWQISDRATLAVGMAATNFAVEGATGEWSCVVCSKKDYAESLPEDIRGPATRWLRVHAEYDDTHPWEALEIIATLLGHVPDPVEVAAIRRAIRSSYAYMEIAADWAMSASEQAGFVQTSWNDSVLDDIHEAA
ncbi:MAG: iron-containing redox enzyme family protein [Paucibacter sp.]|nr:iron-containing redox enzyme family protein [Roseateles sp.]